MKSGKSQSKPFQMKKPLKYFNKNGEQKENLVTGINFNAKEHMEGLLKNGFYNK